MRRQTNPGPWGPAGWFAAAGGAVRARDLRGRGGGAGGAGDVRARPGARTRRDPSLRGPLPPVVPPASRPVRRAGAPAGHPTARGPAGPPGPGGRLASWRAGVGRAARPARGGCREGGAANDGAREKIDQLAEDSPVGGRDGTKVDQLVGGGTVRGGAPSIYIYPSIHPSIPPSLHPSLSPSDGPAHLPPAPGPGRCPPNPRGRLARGWKKKLTSWRRIDQLAVTGGPKFASPTFVKKMVNSEAHLLWEKNRARTNYIQTT